MKIYTKRAGAVCWAFCSLKMLILFIFSFSLFSSSAVAASISIDDKLLESIASAATPNFMVCLDDSGSMDRETLIPDGDEDGTKIPGDASYYYVMPDPGSASGTAGAANAYVYSSYANYYLKEKAPRKWRYQWSGYGQPNSPSTLLKYYNAMYYNPAVTYKPWNTLANASTTTPAAHPYSSYGVTSPVNLGGTYETNGAVTVKNAHYYVYSKSASAPYLINIDGANTLTYYKVTDIDGYIDNGKLELVSVPPDDIKPPSTRSPAISELQNFANWYTYYRKRWLTVAGALTYMIPQFTTVKVGVYSINPTISGNPSLRIPISATKTVSEQNSFIVDALIKRRYAKGGTPLRKALDSVGYYYEKGLDTGDWKSPLATDTFGDCQQNFTMVFTDGYYSNQEGSVTNVDIDGAIKAHGVENDDASGPTEFSGVSPYKDLYSLTLADVAMHYYKRDLRPPADNDKVPTNTVDKARHQHMVTYTVGLGVNGSLPTNVYPASWPDPKVNDDTVDKAKIDDLWHAAVNGRGKYLSAKNPEELYASFFDVLDDITDRVGSAASVAINGEQVSVDLKFYQSMYTYTPDGGWAGDVVKKQFPNSNIAENPNGRVWGAADKLNEKTNLNRFIVTYDPTLKKGKEFQYTSLDNTTKFALTDVKTPTSAKKSQKELFDSKGANASNAVNYLRGDHSKELRKTGGIFRDRTYINTSNAIADSKIGDIVHSSPLYNNGYIYVGSNDGMLHVFNADSGTEQFSYIPNLVMRNYFPDVLGEVDKPTDFFSSKYTHKYFVDSSPFASKMEDDRTFLVGGLGKGGKGVYCLDITNVSGVNSEFDAAKMIKWEYPSVPDTDEDMGYSFSKPYLVKIPGVDKSSAPRWVVIFGNGYNSNNGDAVLYILNAEDGSVINKISTNSSKENSISVANGLSTPNIVDVNGDDVCDYVYAGDLRGHIWKFDLNYFDENDGDKLKIRVSYNGNALFRSMDGSNPQPITSRPDVMLHCKSGYSGTIVVFGTGQYLSENDITNHGVQTIYGIWDYGDKFENSTKSGNPEFIGEFDRSTKSFKNKSADLPTDITLKEQSLLSTQNAGSYVARILTDGSPVWGPVDDSKEADGQQSNPSKDVGWFFDLKYNAAGTQESIGERVVQDVLIRSGAAIVVASIPQSNRPCSPGGQSWLYEINACTGGRDKNGHFDVNNDKKIDSLDMVTVTIDGVPIKVPATGVHYSSLIYPPAIARSSDGSSEIKYMSTSAGTVTSIREKAEKRGIYYWRSY